MFVVRVVPAPRPRPVVATVAPVRSGGLVWHPSGLRGRALHEPQQPQPGDRVASPWRGTPWLPLPGSCDEAA